MTTLIFMGLAVFNSICLCLVNAPILMLAIILIQALMICLMVKSFSSISWYSFILFLVFVGGLMILFIYIVSLASNNNLTISMNKPLIFTLFSSLMIFSLSVMMTSKNNTLSGPTLMETKLWLFKMYSMTSLPTILMVMLYLLLTLMITVSLVLKKSGPLRSIILN
uniref:NADH dehydrogenase subunit 6 n=1 Tax=Friesea antarctica TaxID=2720488 RepID=B2BSE8_9HEXA|nr:NADH dehydrogenase subunit 6 [Friesea antarctica]ABS57601.1 NADH dehydrogenase subunit 6 [Friesea antarctica]